MIKTNLPVILLRGLILLPNNEIRLEFDNDLSKNIIDVSELFHDNMLLVVSSLNPLEEIPEEKDLPKMGVVAKITNKIELPNGKTRVIIKGINRAYVNEYLNLKRPNEVLESIVTNIEDKEIDSKMEKIMINKIKRELEVYIKKVSYISNSILSIIPNISSLSKLTDIIVPNILIDNKRLLDYLNEIDSMVRGEMILEDIYSEKESYEIEKEIDLKVKKNMDDTQKDYLLREKLKVIKEELGEVSSKDDEIEKIKNKISKLNNNKIVDKLNNELKRYESLNQTSPEVGVIKNYIDWLLDLPWNNYTEDNNNLEEVLEVLNKNHFGLERVKNRIIEYLAVKINSHNVESPIICLVGPPGVGKTSLARSIAQSINRKFVKISVGGVDDEAEIKGHRRTYLGAMPGKIIQGMKKCGVNNPVFLIDEIDKMSNNIKGDPASALLEVLDPEQNKYFVDNFIEEEYDLSNVMFLATANSLDTIPEPLKDRLEIIELSSYTEYEKLDIAKKYLIPHLYKTHNASNILFTDDSILKIIRYYTKEAGVRNLERKLEEVVRKVITDRIKNNTNNSVTISDVSSYLGKEMYNYGKVEESEVGVVNGLAYTIYGGDIIKIEVNYYKGNGNLVLTGSLGDVIKESAQIAFSYIKANANAFGIDNEKFIKNDVHVHIPSGATPKDGPSAGIALTTAIISSLSNRKVDSKIAFTGEITLRGNILPIGGLKEKSIGALRSGVKAIYIPEDNLKDLDDIPIEVKKEIEYISFKNYMDLFKKLIKR